MALASAAGSDLIASLPAGGKMIFWAASWVCTWSLTKLCPQSSNPPATARTTVRTSPLMTASASKVLRRIFGASSHRSRARWGLAVPLEKSLSPATAGGQGSRSPGSRATVTGKPGLRSPPGWPPVPRRELAGWRGGSWARLEGGSWARWRQELGGSGVAAAGPLGLDRRPRLLPAGQPAPFQDAADEPHEGQQQQRQHDRREHGHHEEPAPDLAGRQG